MTSLINVCPVSQTLLLNATVASSNISYYSNKKALLSLWRLSEIILYIVFSLASPKLFFDYQKRMFMALKQIEHGSKEYEHMVQLRNEMLRKPLGLFFSPEELAREKNDILIGAFDEDEIIGCCLITKVDSNCAKLRQMAVQKNKQGMGVGESMMGFAENVARDKGYKVLMMHARDTATGFYEKYGYKIKGDQFIEVNVTHHVMEKKLL